MNGEPEREWPVKKNAGARPKCESTKSLLATINLLDITGILVIIEYDFNYGKKW